MQALQQAETDMLDDACNRYDPVAVGELPTVNAEAGA